MDADLMGAAGDGPRRHPGEFLPGLSHHRIFGEGEFRVVILAHGHAFAFAARAFLGQRRLDDAVFLLGHAFHQGPIDFRGIPAGQRVREAGRRLRRARHQQHARCVAVEAMHQLGPYGLFEN